MDATRLRALIECAVNAQITYEASERAFAEAEKARGDARKKLYVELGNLKAAIGTGCVIFGENIIRVGTAGDGNPCVHLMPISTVPVVAPPPAPLPEATPPPAKAAITAPLSGGKVPASQPKK